jgi:hypothetical protein
VVKVSSSELFAQASTTARQRLSLLIASAAEMASSHQMWTAMMNAEIRVRPAGADVAGVVAPVLDNLVFLAHDALVIYSTDSAQRAVRLLDMRLEITLELAAHQMFQASSHPQTVVAAAALRTGAEHPVLHEVSAISVQTVDPTVLSHAFRASPDSIAVAEAILQANPSISAHELLAATSATALPQQRTSTRSFQ